MSLYLKILQMMHHPVKRLPLPYIYASVKFPLNNDPEFTEKSNAVPPCWNRNTFKFNLSKSTFEENENENEKNLRITLIESRLFMVEEPLGFCDIFIPSLPRDKILIQWVNLHSLRDYLPNMMCLLMIQCNTNDDFSSNCNDNGLVNLNENSTDGIVFDAPLASPEEKLQFEPWDPREIDLKYFDQNSINNLLFSSTELQDGLNEDENKGFEDNEEQMQYQSSLKSILKMFSDF